MGVGLVIGMFLILQKLDTNGCGSRTVFAIFGWLVKRGLLFMGGFSLGLLKQPMLKTLIVFCVSGWVVWLGGVSVFLRCGGVLFVLLICLGSVGILLMGLSVGFRLQRLEV